MKKWLCDYSIVLESGLEAEMDLQVEARTISEAMAKAQAELDAMKEKTVLWNVGIIDEDPWPDEEDEGEYTVTYKLEDFEKERLQRLTEVMNRMCGTKATPKETFESMMQLTGGVNIIQTIGFWERFYGIGRKTEENAPVQQAEEGEEGNGKG